MARLVFRFDIKLLDEIFLRPVRVGRATTNGDARELRCNVVVKLRSRRGLCFVPRMPAFRKLGLCASFALCRPTPARCRADLLLRPRHREARFAFAWLMRRSRRKGVFAFSFRAASNKVPRRPWLLPSRSQTTSIVHLQERVVVIPVAVENVLNVRAIGNRAMTHDHSVHVSMLEPPVHDNTAMGHQRVCRDGRVTSPNIVPERLRFVCPYRSFGGVQLDSLCDHVVCKVPAHRFAAHAVQKAEGVEKAVAVSSHTNHLKELRLSNAVYPQRLPR